VRPLSLTIEGLTSFKTSQQVDLSELDLFVITGPTGSGKSSILDAITFAIYGSVARVNGHELRDLISHGSTYMRVCLDFQVDGQHYRVARRIGKNKHEATLERVENGSAVTEVEQGGIRAVNERLEDIVGLDFKAFTKAVLLPQGAFQEFLTGEVGERRRILMRLLDLGRYEAAGQAARREATRLDAIVGERLALIESIYEDATAERLRELKTTAKQALKHHSKLEDARSDAKSVADEAVEAERSGAALSENVAEIDTELVELNRLVESWSEIETDERTTQDGLEATEKALMSAQKSLDQTRKKLELTINRIGDAAALAQIAAAAVAYKREHAELERLDGELAGARNDAKQQSNALAEARVDEASAKTAVDEHVKVRERAEAAKQSAELVERCAMAVAVLGNLDEELALGQDEAKSARIALDDARKRLRHLEEEHGAVLLRAGLTAGDHCPVCNAVVETLPEPDEDAGARLETATRAAHAASSGEEAARAALVALETRRKAAADELKEVRALLPKTEAIPTPAEAAAALAGAEETRAAAALAETAARIAFEDAASAASKAETTAGSANTKAEGIGENRNGADTRLKAAQSVLTATFGSKLPDDVAEEIARRRDELKAVEDTHRAAGEATEAARVGREEAQRARAECVERVASFDQEFVATRTAARFACEAIARQLAGADLPAVPPEDAMRTTLLTEWPTYCEERASAARHAIARFSKQIESAARTLAQLADQTGVELEARSPAEIVRHFDNAVTEAHGAVVAAEKDVEALTTRISERETLEQEITKDRKLCTLHQTLARELRTDHFIAFVLEESMTRLAAQASDQLCQISGGRYSLVAEEGSFEVIDHHNADERRSVATLSGGETFLASLSLALALSVGLRELAGTAAGRLEAIFIDEGFGALDPETLDVVVEALERLREGERMIGVITHVPTLAERIPSGLSVMPNGNSSRIRVR